MYCVNGTENDVTENYKIIDTYSYLLNIANAYNVVDKSDYTSKFYDSIKITIPNGYEASDIVFATYKGNSLLSTQIEDNTATFSDIKEGDEYLISVKTKYDGIIPNVYNSNKYYKVIQYDDENKGQEWYYPYLFKATNLGIINGDEQSDGSLPFHAQKSVTISEFLKMLIESAGVSGNEINAAVENQKNNITDEIKEHWAKKYICYALDKNITDINNVSNGNSPDTNILRCDAAYMITRMYIDYTNHDSVNVPSNLYKFSDDVSSDKNTLWKTGKAFKDQNEILYCKDEIKQLYLNGIMEGDTNGYVNWSQDVKRSEATKLIIKCKFSLDEGISNAEIENEGMANYIDLMNIQSTSISYLNDKNGSGEFYFVAPKTGYYYISDMNNCTVVVEDMQKREIKGLDAYDSSTQTTNGARYNILKGEKAYISISKSSSNYSFTISKPSEGELVFAPDRSGTFIYDNCPEYILQEDLADYDKGNTCLITAKNIFGDVTMSSSHLIRSKAATLGSNHDEICCNDSNIKFDYLISNPTDKVATVCINKIGIQTPGKDGTSNDYTYKAAAGFQMWSDYTGKDINVTDQLPGKASVLTRSGSGYNYESYISKSGKWGDTEKALIGTTITLYPRETKWLFGDNCLDMEVDKSGYSFAMMVNCTVDGMVNISSTAFHKRDKVLSPHVGKIYLNNSDRCYDGDEYVNGKIGESGEIGEKYKGISNTTSVVQAESEWIITNDEQSAFFAPIIYNRSYSSGQKTYFSSVDTYNYKLLDGSSGQISSMNFWITHCNSESTKSYIHRIAGSDMLSLKFEGTRIAPEGENDVEDTFIFDNYHRNTNNRNVEVDNTQLENGLAINMANFSVTEKYHITITNSSDEDKTVSYLISNKSGFFYSYKISGGEEIDNIKGETSGIDGDNMKFYELLNFVVQKGATETLELEITIPNVGSSQTSNMLWAR